MEHPLGVVQFEWQQKGNWSGSVLESQAPAETTLLMTRQAVSDQPQLHLVVVGNSTGHADAILDVDRCDNEQEVHLSLPFSHRGLVCTLLAVLTAHPAGGYTVGLPMVFAFHTTAAVRQ